MIYNSLEAFRHIRRVQFKTSKQVNDIFAGAYHSVFKGKGIEFENVRAYEAGDDERNIDWNVTARLNFPFVKTFREERELTVMLIIDISASSHFGTTQRSKSELIAEIGAILAFSAIKNNDKVGVLLFSSEVELFIPPKKGLRHVLRVIRELLFFQPKQLGTNLSQALSVLSKVQRKPAICFLISDFICEDFTCAAKLVAKHHDLIAISIHDPLEMHFPSMGLIQMSDLETEQEVLIDTSHPSWQQAYTKQYTERTEKQRKFFQQIGASLISIQTDQDHVQALQFFFKRRGRHR